MNNRNDMQWIMYTDFHNFIQSIELKRRHGQVLDMTYDALLHVEEWESTYKSYKKYGDKIGRFCIEFTKLRI